MRLSKSSSAAAPLWQAASRFTRAVGLGLVQLAVGCVPAGCAPASRPPVPMAPLVVPPLDPRAAPVDALRFPEGSKVPHGCFAMSRDGHEVVCLLGEYSPGSAAGERRLARLTNGDGGYPDVEVGAKMADGSAILDSDSRQTLDDLMRDGGYVALGQATMIPMNHRRELGGLRVELSHPRRGRFADDFLLLVWTGADRRNGGGSGSGGEEEEDGDGDDRDGEIFRNTLSDVPCEAPMLGVRMIGDGRVLIERECRFTKDGDTHVVFGAWLCSRDAARCD